MSAYKLFFTSFIVAVAFSKAEPCAYGYGMMEIAVDIVRHPEISMDDDDNYTLFTWEKMRSLFPQVKDLQFQLVIKFDTQSTPKPEGVFLNQTILYIDDWVPIVNETVQKTFSVMIENVSFVHKWNQTRQFGQVMSVYCNLQEKWVGINYERDLHNTKLFFWVQQITVNYLDCQVPKETYTCRNPSINMERTDEIKERRQFDHHCLFNGTRPTVIPWKYTTPKSKLDYDDYDYNMMFTYAPNNKTEAKNETDEERKKRLSIFIPKPSNHNGTTIGVIAAFLILMLIQNVIFPIIVFTLLK